MKFDFSLQKSQMKKFLLFKFLLIVLSINSVAQYNWHVNTTSCSTIEVSSFDFNRSYASVLLYEKINGFYTIRQSSRLDTSANSVSFTDLPNSIYRTVIIFDQKYEGNYTLWNAVLNTSADIHLNCLQYRTGKATFPEIIIEPNPTSNSVRIMVDNKENEIINSKIFSTNGTLVKQFTFKESQTEIHLEDIQSGSYFVQFIINNYTITKKLIKI